MKTLRQAIVSLLEAEEASARELAQRLGVKEKEVYGHLVHIQRSLEAHGKRIAIRPSRCLKCGYEFKDRIRFTRPGRCPRCKGTHLNAPLFRVN